MTHNQGELVYLVDDDEAILDSLTFLMEGYGLQVQAFSRGAEFLDTVDLGQPGCVILDSRMPELTGQDLHQKLNDANSPLAVIFLTGHGDVPMAVEALKNGAFDFFQKPVQGRELHEAVQRGLAHSHRLHHDLTQLALLKDLTEREQQVFRLVINGYTNKQMADTLFVSVRTIEVHRSNVMKKLHASNMAGLLKYSSLLDSLEP
ncbi:response regulator transcription factor [Ferrimonas sediminicola]|uniref:Response regulator transcription factor n=1 Tax=Ferrimonas sediminicola TaxID=2569538 RepID=A0A4U1BIM6_9GAMM|nr:response regulator [Ferrimonas sediminicola]TKB49896.1 response regulator transcription factor [Ferrimonas sediminicola]